MLATVAAISTRRHRRDRKDDEETSPADPRMPACQIVGTVPRSSDDDARVASSGSRIFEEAGSRERPIWNTQRDDRPTEPGSELDVVGVSHRNGGFWRSAQQ